MAHNALSLSRQLCFSVYSTAHAFTRFYKPLLDGLGLTYPQYLVMLVLWEADGVSVKALGERLMLDSGTLTPLLKRLDSAGLITRARRREDERQLVICLTPQGAALREKAEAIPANIGCATGLGAEAAREMKTALDTLRGHMLAARG